MVRYKISHLMKKNVIVCFSDTKFKIKSKSKNGLKFQQE